jgi:hypothetical protein
MRILMVLTGALLWLNAFDCREEFFEACALACKQIEVATRSNNAPVLIQGILAGIFTTLVASPVWKFAAGSMFLKLSLESEGKSYRVSV